MNPGSDIDVTLCMNALSHLSSMNVYISTVILNTVRDAAQKKQTNFGTFPKGGVMAQSKVKGAHFCQL